MCGHNTRFGQTPSLLFARRGGGKVRKVRRWGCGEVRRRGGKEEEGGGGERNYMVVWYN